LPAACAIWYIVIDRARYTFRRTYDPVRLHNFHRTIPSVCSRTVNHELHFRRQTCFLGNKKETVMSWQVDARPKETMTVTIRNRLVASETTRLAAGGRWNHVCFQWKDSTGVWAIFVNAKIHSVGQTPAADDNVNIYTRRFNKK